MNTLLDKAKSARYGEGYVTIQMESGLEYRFPVAANSRLKDGSEEQLSNIEVSPFGLHWPDLDEDLSFRGIQAGNFGQG
jgi:hypothetical protein